MKVALEQTTILFEDPDPASTSHNAALPSLTRCPVIRCCLCIAPAVGRIPPPAFSISGAAAMRE